MTLSFWFLNQNLNTNSMNWSIGSPFTILPSVCIFNPQVPSLVLTSKFPYLAYLPSSKPLTHIRNLSLDYFLGTLPGHKSPTLPLFLGRLFRLFHLLLVFSDVSISGLFLKVLPTSLIIDKLTVTFPLTLLSTFNW